jgi:hypothetical protein
MLHGSHETVCQKKQTKTDEEKTCSTCKDVQHPLHKKCYYLRTFLSVEEAGNSAPDPESLPTIAVGPREEEGSRKMDSDSLSS